MANKVLNTRIKLKYDLEQNWLASNIVLMQGELAFVVDSLEAPTSLRIKCGDGSTAFKDLPYATQPPAEMTTLIQEAVEAEFDKRFVDGLFLQCGGANPSVKLPEFVSDEIINDAINETLAKILNTEY